MGALRKKNGIDFNNMNGFISTVARLNVLSADEGGQRKTGIKSGYRPNHVFEKVIDNRFNAFIGEITFNGREFIYPGEEVIVNVKFLDGNEIEDFIHVGKAWQIYEGSKLIADAVILEVF